MHQHDDNWEQNFRRFEKMARRGFGRLAGLGSFGKWSDFDGLGDNFRIGRMLASGDLRLVALFLIEQQPRHGYDLIKAIEERSGGFYAPSPGVVYPALTFLEEAGYVTSAADGNKKLYTITGEGRAHLSDNREAIEGTLRFLEKAGSKMRDWREKVAGGEWPFEGGRDDEPGPFRHGPRQGPGPGFRTQHHRGPGHGPGPDRDMRDVIPEMNDARRDLKAAIADAVVQGEAEQRRVAAILREAAGNIRRGTAEDDVDL